MADRYVVVLGAGSLREDSGSVVPHGWTTDGVSMRCEATGTHALHMAVAGGVLEQVYRALDERDVHLHGVQVRAEGAVEEGHDDLGIEWSVAIDSGLPFDEAVALIDSLDPVSELPESVHGGVDVRRVGHD